MRAWWQGREPREQALLAIAGVLTLAIMLFFGLWQPVTTARADAQIALDQAADDLDLVEQGLARLSQSAGERRAPAENGDAFRTEMTALARQRGLAVTRLQSSGEGTLILSFDAASPQLLFVFLQEAGAYPGGQILSASLAGRGGDMVQATIELQGTKTR